MNAEEHDMMDFEAQFAAVLEWQSSPEGMVEGQVTALLVTTGDLVESSIHGERRPLLPVHLPHLVTAYNRLGRLISRYREKEAA